MNTSYEAAVTEINRRAAATAGFTGNPVLDDAKLDLGLVRSRALLDALSAPDRQLRIIHIAGSKGKGTTAAFVANILTDSSHRTGLSTSPHLHSYRERIAINGQLISPEAFGTIAGQVFEATTRIEHDRPELGAVSAFEILVAMSLRHFADQGCEFAVLEVGLGGRYDNTNVVAPEVSVITTLELEHTAILGPTIQDIAWNKAGIIKPGVPVVSSRQEPEAAAVLLEIAAAQDAALLLDGRDWSWRGTSRDFAYVDSQARIEHLRIAMPGAHQCENAAAAIATVLQLIHEGMPPGEPAIRSGLRRTSLPGRFEIVEHQGRTIVLDVAHTPASARLLTEALDESSIVDPVVVAGFLRDKDIVTIAAMLAKRSRRVHLAPVDSPRTAAFDALSDVARELGSETVLVHSTIEEAWQASLENAVPECPIVVTGSMKAVAQIRQLLCLTGNS
jgi:dihydrofolate synthase/folylpolyglutamate synthase